jgi:hypothetical protein
MSDVPRWRQRSPLALNEFSRAKPLAPQIAAAAFQVLIILGGPLIGLVTISSYPFLITDHSLIISALISLTFWFLASFGIFGNEAFPRSIPRGMRLAFRGAFGICQTFLLFGLIGIANGYDTPLIKRDVAVVAKHRSLARDPAKRKYYVAVRAWPPSRSIVEVGVSHELYDQLRVPVTRLHTPDEELEAMANSGIVRLILGQGRLGLEWLKAVERSD